MCVCVFWERKVTHFIAISVLKVEALKVILFASAFRSASGAVDGNDLYPFCSNFAQEIPG